jgi:hypothetical protein
MPSAILDGLSVVDTTGFIILASTFVVLVFGVGINLAAVARYAALGDDLKRGGTPSEPFQHAVLNRIVRDVESLLVGRRELNAQAIVEDRFQSDLKPLLLAERFVKAATGLVIILGLLGTFYGLTLSVGRLVHLVAADAPVGSDVTQTIGKGLTQSLSGMAVAFSNSLFGVGSAVVLTVVGVMSSVTDRRIALMVQIETYIERLASGIVRARADGSRAPAGALPAAHEGSGIERAVGDFGYSVARLDDAVVRFESALEAFATGSREFREFNAHLKDNIQRLSLSFGDFSDELKEQIVALRSTGRN